MEEKLKEQTTIFQITKIQKLFCLVTTYIPHRFNDNASKYIYMDLKSVTMIDIHVLTDKSVIAFWLPLSFPFFKHRKENTNSVTTKVIFAAYRRGRMV